MHNVLIITQSCNPHCKHSETEPETPRTGKTRSRATHTNTLRSPKTLTTSSRRAEDDNDEDTEEMPTSTDDGGVHTRDLTRTHT